jgi:hypothetical protein
MRPTVVFPAAADKIRFPTTRSQGRLRRNELEETLTGKIGVFMIIDFSDVDAMTISYADEFLGKFLASFDGAEHDVTVAVQCLNTENLEAVQIALERRQTDVVMLRDEGVLMLIGDQRLSETFDAANKLGSFKAGDLAALLDISPQNANNRLRPLVEVGALRKSRVSGAARGGKEFLYTAINRADADAYADPAYA